MVIKLIIMATSPFRAGAGMAADKEWMPAHATNDATTARGGGQGDARGAARAPPDEVPESRKQKRWRRTGIRIEKGMAMPTAEEQVRRHADELRVRVEQERALRRRAEAEAEKEREAHEQTKRDRRAEREERAAAEEDRQEAGELRAALFACNRRAIGAAAQALSEMQDASDAAYHTGEAVQRLADAAPVVARAGMQADVARAAGGLRQQAGLLQAARERAKRALEGSARQVRAANEGSFVRMFGHADYTSLTTRRYERSHGHKKNYKPARGQGGARFRRQG